MPALIHPDIQNLVSYLDQAPTAWHAVDYLSEELSKNGFIHLKEGERWQIRPEGKYYVIRNGSSLCAFTMPSGTPSCACILGAHTDSPALRLKPNAEYRNNNMILFGVEVYGAPLVASWLNRDLGLAGRVAYVDGKGCIRQNLVTLRDHPFVIPQLAPHLDREVNTKGVILNFQEHLSVFGALDTQLPQGTSYLETLLKEKIDSHSLMSTELFFFPLEPARFLGFQQQLISSYRIDNLASTHAAFKALLRAKQPQPRSIQMIAFWDNEEIGSTTAQGASSPFLSHVLERACLCLNLNREDFLCLQNKSLCISVDMAHALNPNYSSRYDPQHQPLMDRGVVLKVNAQQRYASDAIATAFVKHTASTLRLPLQSFVSRGDIPSGTTIGPLNAAKTGIKTIDLGYPQLSMHSARETASQQDHLEMCKLLTGILENFTQDILEY